MWLLLVGRCGRRYCGHRTGVRYWGIGPGPSKLLWRAGDPANTWQGFSAKYMRTGSLL